MELQWSLGTRFLLSSRKNTFLSAIAVLSLLGVATGVCFLIMVLAVMAGFEQDLKQKIIGLDAHVTVTGENGLRHYESMISQIEKVPGVQSVTPYLEGEVLVSTGEENRGAILRGIDPSSAAKVFNFESSFSRQCVALTLKECFSVESRAAPLIVGAELASELKILWDPQQSIKLISPLGYLGPFGYEPRVRLFHFLDTFRSGFYEYDTRIIFTPLLIAQQYFSSRDAVSALGIKAFDLDQTPLLKKSIAKVLSESGQKIKVEDWQDRNRKLFSALKLEKFVMFVVLLLIVLVASFVILVTMAMLVLEKSSAIAVLRTLGMTKKKITQIFLIDGAVIGVVGSILGLIAGLLLCYCLDRYHFVELPPQYYITTIPVLLKWGDITTIVCASIVLAILATLYPALKAAATDPVELLRYE